MHSLSDSPYIMQVMSNDPSGFVHNREENERGKGI